MLLRKRNKPVILASQKVLGQKIIQFGIKFADQDALGKNTMPY
jgi:hypothetical protein